MMMKLIKADFKKTYYLPGHRNYLIALCLLSIIFGLTFLFTIGVTQGKELTGLQSIEVIDITLLGMDVASIMLIIFTATFISKEFSQGSIHTSLAIMPLRQKFYVSKVLFITVLSLVVSIIITLVIFGLDQFVLFANNMGLISFSDQGLLPKLIGAIILPFFYSLLSVAGTFFLQSAAGGIVFAIGVMFLPAFIKLFPESISDGILTVFPEKSLHTLTEISANGQLISTIFILLSWVLISNFLGLWKLKKADF